MPGLPRISGDPPALAGSVCEELLVQQMWCRGELTEPANLIFPRFGGRWHRLYLDPGVVYWRLQDSAPEAQWTADEFTYVLVDLGRQLGVRATVLDRLDVGPVDGGCEVRFVFVNGATATFRCVDEVTTYWAEPGAAADGGGM